MTTRFNVSNIADGISVIDSGYFSKDFAAIYILRQGNEVAIIETGNKYSATNVQKALKMDGLSFSDVTYIIPTHVHLDHAGGAGELMNRCQNAQLIVHPRGARHMIDPSKLIAGAIAVYGETNYKKLYCEITPIESTRVIEADDNFVINFNGRELKFIDTPGMQGITFVSGISKQNLCLREIRLESHIVTLIRKMKYIFSQAQALFSLILKH